mgnify:CR=1 FL=1
MKTLAICNNKGGCGKTTTAYHLGRLLAGRDYRILLVDLDPQANLSARLHAPGTPPPWDNTIDAVLGGAASAKCRLSEIIVEVDCTWRSLHLAPSSDELANVALGLLHDVIAGRMALRRALHTVEAQYDLAIVDCPPEAGILLANALLAADGLLLVAEPETDAMAGMVRVAKMAATVREDRERATPVTLGMVATMADLRTNLHQAGLYLMEQRNDIAPLWGIVPQRNGETRDHELAVAYAAVAEKVEGWLHA